MIRSLRPEDRALYMKLVDEFYHSPAVAHPVDPNNYEITFDEFMRSDTYTECFIIEHEGEPAGYAIIAKTFSQECGGPVIWLEELYILPQFRSMGLGREYFAFVERELAPRAARLRLEVEPDNSRAIRLYRSLGYTELGYGQMVKELR